jgi:DNA invertase Pin-like site-specific DNA recombinase
MSDKTHTRLVGYARVSTGGQDLELQLDALRKAGCSKKDIFTEKVSGAKANRPGLQACLEHLKEGDTLAVWRLDRLGRSMGHLVSLVTELQKRGVGFKSLCDGAIDTTTASGELIFHIFSSLAQFERRLIQERTRAGLDAARARGRKGGRRRIESTDPRVKLVDKLAVEKKLSIPEICATMKISRATYYRYLAAT